MSRGPRDYFPPPLSNILNMAITSANTGLRHLQRLPGIRS